MKNKLENVFIRVGDATPSKIKNYFESRGVDTKNAKCNSTDIRDCYGVIDGVFREYWAETIKNQGGIFVIPMEIEGTFIKCGTATPEQIKKYFASRGIETHPYDLKCTDAYHCYGVFQDSFGIFGVEYVSKFDAEFIDLNKTQKAHPLDNKFIVCGKYTKDQIVNFFNSNSISTNGWHFDCDDKDFCYCVVDGKIDFMSIGTASNMGRTEVLIEEVKPKHPLHNKFIVCGTATKEQLDEFFKKNGIKSDFYHNIDSDRYCYGVYYNRVVLVEVEFAKRGGGEFITIEEEKPKQSTYYYLMSSNGGKPNRKHQTIESAREEAKRILLTDASQKSVEILQCVEVFKIEKSVSSESLK